MYRTQLRKKPNQGYVKARFNNQVNTTKKLNKTLNKRGGIKL